MFFIVLLWTIDDRHEQVYLSVKAVIGRVTPPLGIWPCVRSLSDGKHLKCTSNINFIGKHLETCISLGVIVSNYWLFSHFACEFVSETFSNLSQQ